MVVLLVDSNAAARSARSAAMRQQGWHVFDADGAAAGAAWLAEADSLNLLVTEAVFDASSTGFDLRDRARKKFPATRVIFTTRYNLEGFEQSVRDTPVLIDKPLSAEDLVAKIATLMAATNGTAPAEAPPLLPPGTLLGNNQIIDRLYTEREAETYRALQRAVQRQVAMVVLKPEYLARPEVVQEFKERERIKASVTHPRIAPLFEAGEENGWHFYTREMPPGRSLEELQVAGVHLSERALAEVLFGIADAMSFSTERGYHHRSLGARDIYVDGENHSSIVNVIRPPATTPRDQKADIRALLAMFRPVVGEGKARGLLQSLASEEHDWAGLLCELTELREAMRDRSVMRMAEKADLIAPVANTDSKPTVVLWMVGACVLIIAAWLGSRAGKGYTPPPAAEKNSEMVWVPPGEFVYQQGQRRGQAGFAISKYEVTIGQYAAFLEALGKSDDPRKYDHADQPPTKRDHKPEDWSKYYAAAATGAAINGQTLSLDSPIVRVDWWDAYAFAKWKGQRLPTEEEWEKAARGSSGNLYPWGKEAKPDAANLGDDYDATGAKGGSVDGYNLWAPVKSLRGDVTELGVVGMAGNVEEWTSTWAMHPELPDVRVPVVRGGHFALKSGDQLLTRRYFTDSADEAALARGFRTASDAQPPP